MVASMQCLVAEPLSVTPMSPGAACAGVVLVEASDVPPNPFYLSVEDGALISGAIAGVWLLAWSLKAIRSVLDDKNLD